MLHSLQGKERRAPRVLENIDVLLATPTSRDLSVRDDVYFNMNTLIYARQVI